MSVYLKGDSVLLDGSGNVATDEACCCATGACCIGTDCTIHTESDCDSMGGIYRGDGSVCDPNPCTTFPSCPCGFDAFDGSGRRFLTQTAVIHFDEEHPSDPVCTLTYDGTEVVTFDPISCVLHATSCDGSGSYNLDGCGSGSLSVENDGDRCCVPIGSIMCGNCPGFYEGDLHECPRAFATMLSELGPITVTDATHGFWDGSGGGSTTRVDITLSDECTPV